MFMHIFFYILIRVVKTKKIDIIILSLYQHNTESFSEVLETNFHGMKMESYMEDMIG